MKNIIGDRLLFIDTETGGIDATKHSLLSIGLVVWDSRDGILASEEYFIKHDDYVVTGKAKSINKFNKDFHEKQAMSEEEVIKELILFCQKYFDKNILIPVAGHNTQFDVSFLKILLKNNGRSYEKIFSHRIIDTYTLLRSLYYANIIEKDISSSAQAFKYFSIKVNGRHTAKGDAIATAELYTELLKKI